MLSDGTWTYTWKQGRQLASMSGSGTWTFTYDADGMRTKCTKVRSQRLFESMYLITDSLEMINSTPLGLQIDKLQTKIFKQQ